MSNKTVIEISRLKGETADQAKKRVVDDFVKRGEDLNKYEFVDKVDEAGNPKGKEDEAKREGEVKKEEPKEEMKKEEVKKDDPIIKETKQEAEMGANLPVNTSYVAAPLPTPSKVAQESMSTRVNIDTTPIRVTIPIRNTFKSFLTFKKSTYDERVIWDFNSEAKIKTFNDKKTFILASSELVMRLVQHFDGLMVDFDKMVEPKFRVAKITDPAKAGFDVYGFIDGLRPDHYHQVVSLLSKIGNRDTDDLPIEEVVGFMHKIEFDCYSRMNAIRMRRLISVDEEWKWFKNMDDEFTILAPLPDALDRRFVRSIEPGPLKTWNVFVLKNSNMYSPAYSMVRGLIDSRMQVGVEREASTLREMLERLQVAINRYSRKANFASTITQGAAREALLDLATVYLNGKICRISYEPDPEQLSLETLVSCICFKLLVNDYMLTPRSINKIDNYLLVHFVQYFRTYNPDIARWTMSSVRSGDVNELEIALKDKVITDFKTRNALVSFLLSDRKGHGWTSAGMPREIPKPTNSDKFMNDNRILAYHYSGKEIINPDTERTDQFKAFQELVRVTIAGDPRARTWRMLPPSEEIGNAFIAVLQKFSEMGTRVSYMAYMMDRVAKRLGPVSVMLPISYADQPHEENSNWKTVPQRDNSMPSVFLLADFQNFKPVGLDPSLYQWGWGINEFFNEVTEKMNYIFDRFRNPLWNKKERIEMALRLVSVDAGWKRVLVEKLGAAPQINDMTIPDRALVRTDFFDMVDIVEKQITQAPWLFGYAPRFYFSGGTYGPIPDQFQRAFLVDGRMASQHLTREQWELLVQSHGVTTMFRDLRDKRKIIEFKFPVPITSAESKGPIKENVPLDPNRQRPGETTALTYFYTWKDDHLIDTENLAVLSRDPEFTMDFTPYILEDHVYVNKLIYMFKSWKKGFSIFDQYRVISTAAM